MYCIKEINARFYIYVFCIHLCIVRVCVYLCVYVYMCKYTHAMKVLLMHSQTYVMHIYLMLDLLALDAYAYYMRSIHIARMDFTLVHVKS